MNSEPIPFKPTSLENEVPLEWHVGDVILNTYEVKQVFTSGGMALVYRVFHRGWAIDLAVKSPREEALTFDGSAENIIHEAETWVNLGLHPHVVSCYYVRLLGGVPRIFMEYVNSGSLSDGIEQGWLYTGAHEDVIKRMLDYTIQFAWGLDFAHEHGLIHQDVKPANVLLTDDGIAKVTDFGIAQARAKMRKTPSNPIPLDMFQDNKSILVDTVGLTPAYCSPEQAAANPLSRRTDIWSWAVSVLEMFAGKKTWKSGPNALEGLDKCRTSGPEYEAIPRIPTGLANILEQCFALSPDARPKDMHVIADQLREVYQQVTGQSYSRIEPKMDTAMADTLNNRAVSLLDLNREEDALDYFDEALSTETTHPAALYNRSLFQWRKGRETDQDVVTALSGNLKNHIGDWEPNYFLGLIHLERGDLAEAARTARSAITTYGPQPALQNILNLSSRSSGQMDGSFATLKGTQGIVNSVAISPRGNFAVSGGNDNLVRVWDIATGACTLALEGHSQIVRAVRLTPDGKYALSGSWDETLRLWNLAMGDCVRVFKGHADYIQDVDITHDGRRAVSASADSTLRVWDLATGECLHILSGHSDTVWAVALSPDNRTAISASYDYTLRVWDIESGECLNTIDWMRTCTSNICLTVDGKFLLLGAGDNRLWLLDIETGKTVRSFAGHSGGVNAVAVAPNGIWALSGGLDGTLRLWDLNSGRCLRTYAGHDSAVNSITVCSGRMLAATASSDQTIRLWVIRPGVSAPYVTVFPRSSSEVLELSSQVESDLKSAEDEFATGRTAEALEIITAARLNPEYKQNQKLTTCWDKIGQKCIRKELKSTWQTQNYIIHTARVNGIAISPDNQTALTCSDDKTLGMWNLATGGCLREMRGHTDAINAAVFLPGGKFILSGSSDGSLRIWKLESGECIRVLGGHTSAVNSVAISPDGRLAVSSSNDQSLRVWSLTNGQSVRSLKGHTHYVRRAVFLPNAAEILSASWDKSLRLWDVSSGECIRVFTGHEEVIEVMAVSPDGRLAASGGTDHTLRVWDLDAGQPAGMYKDINHRVTSLVFSSDSQYLFSGEDDGSIHIWSIQLREHVMSFMAHTQPVSAIEIMRDGSSLVSASSDHFLKVWKLDWHYSLPERIEITPGCRGLLSAFIDIHKPYDAERLVHSGRSAWSQKDFQGLMDELAMKGYGYLSEADVMSELKRLYRL